MSAELTPREVDELRFAVRADRLAMSESARLKAAVERILTDRLSDARAHLEDAREKNRRLRRKLRECREALS